MSLDQAKLVSALRAFMDPGSPGFAWPASRSAAIDLWSDAYDGYASDAADYSGDLVVTKNPEGFRCTLSAEFSDTWTASEAAAALRDAWIAYWASATFSIGTLPPPSGICPNSGGNTVFSVELSSVVSVINGAPLYSALVSIFSELGTDGEQKAEEIAQAFHQATTANISVLISGLDSTPPPAGPLPITNTCQVF